VITGAVVALVTDGCGVIFCKKREREMQKKIKIIGAFFKEVFFVVWFQNKQKKRIV
jgi:hypothetical protein